ncbi:MAG TPA: PEP-CTERM sorting domain-containing protein [Planctomycetes bacterium]|nr:PEP-CTERM sorting domain-containing protein [Planctomycetota bacterium]HIJ70512.1 PEP-CTERM sorting domain-containing protein [Planctomycetota bacterium]
MKAKSIWVSATIILFSVLPAHGAIFEGLGYVGDSSWSTAFGVSADGSVVVGTSGPGAFRWEAGQMTGLGDLYGGTTSSTGYAASGDGSVVVGFSLTPYPWLEAFNWTSQGGMVGLGSLPDTDGSVAYGVSSDGSVVVGASGAQAFRWTSESGMVSLGSGDAIDVSSDGSVVVGQSGFASGPEAFRWTSDGGMVGLGDLMGGNSWSLASEVSYTGSIVVGYSESEFGTEAFRWEDGSNMTGLGDLAGGSFYSEACGVSEDGSVVIGFSDTGNDILAPTNSNIELGVEAFIWDADNGMRKLQDVFVNDYGLDLTGWTLSHATDISADGLTIVGDGKNPTGNTEAWIFTVPEPATILLFGLGALLLRKRN